MNITITGEDTQTARYLAQAAGHTPVSGGGEREFAVTERLTVSKNAVYEWLCARGVPVPARFPEGSEPYIVRPDADYGSRGIWVTEDFCEAGGAVNAGFLVQEFLPGPVRCAQVTGTPGEYAVHPVLELCVDDRYVAQSAKPAQDAALSALAEKLAALLGLRGYLCVKAVDGCVISLDDRLAGLPARALYDLCGINLFDTLLELA